MRTVRVLRGEGLREGYRFSAHPETMKGKLTNNRSWRMSGAELTAEGKLPLERGNIRGKLLLGISK